MIPSSNHPWHRGKVRGGELTNADLLDLPSEDSRDTEDFDIPAVERRRLEANRPLIEAGYDPSVGTLEESGLCLHAFGRALPIQEGFGCYVTADAVDLGNLDAPTFKTGYR